MTRIVVLADTHLPRRGRLLPHEVLQALEGADLLIHLGDFTGQEVVPLIERYAPLRGVRGNNDTPEIRARFPDLDRLEIEGQRLAMLHGHLGGRTALEAARKVDDADIVLFGHSHQPHNSREGGRLLFNPGSPTDQRWSPHRAFGVIDLRDGQVRARVVPLR